MYSIRTRRRHSGGERRSETRHANRLHRLTASALMTVDSSSAARIHRLLLESGADGTAFRLVAGAVRTGVSRCLAVETTLSSAAISLGQEEALGEMVSELADIRRELDVHMPAESVSERSPDIEKKSSGGALPQWWFLLAEATEILNDQIARLRTLSPGQERDAPARRLCSIVIRVLRAHHHRLQSEAESWMN